MYRNKKHNYPLYQVNPLTDLRDLVDGAAERYGERTLVRYKRNGEVTDVTYNRFKYLVDSYGTQLVEMGVSPKHVAILGDNSYEWFLTYVTLLNCDGVVMPVDKELPVEDIQYILTHGDAEAIAYTPSMKAKIEQLMPLVPKVTTYICIQNPKDKLIDGHFLMENIIARGSVLLDSGDKRYTSIKRDVHALKQLIFTSGTTGVAKGVMLSEHNTVYNIVAAQQLMLITERCLSVLPYNHSYESTHGLLTMMHHGMTICINESLRTFLPNLKLYKPTEMLLVPLFVEKIYKRIWAQAEDKGKDKLLRKLIKVSDALLKCGIDLRKSLFKSVTQVFGGELRYIISGGAPLRAEIASFFYSIGVILINGYGITECAPIVSVNRNEYHDNATVGLPLDGSRVRIDSPDENGEGEICVQGENVMLGYYKDPDATAKVIVDDWFHTGDIGRIDERGFLYVTGRIKNLIVLKSGKNVYPEEIEDKLGACSLIGDVIIRAQCDDIDNEAALCAVIYPDQDALKRLGKDELEKQINEFIAVFNDTQPKYKMIKQVQFLDKEFEKTTTRKIKRKENY